MLAFWDLFVYICIGVMDEFFLTVDHCVCFVRFVELTESVPLDLPFIKEVHHGSATFTALGTWDRGDSIAVGNSDSGDSVRVLARAAERAFPATSRNLAMG